MVKIQEFFIKLIPHDKALHFVFGFVLFVLLNLFLNDFQSLGVVFLLSLAKETRDEITYRGGDAIDVVFTIIPGVILLFVNLS